MKTHSLEYKLQQIIHCFMKITSKPFKPTLPKKLYLYPHLCDYSNINYLEKNLNKNQRIFLSFLLQNFLLDTFNLL